MGNIDRMTSLPAMDAAVPLYTASSLLNPIRSNCQKRRKVATASTAVTGKAILSIQRSGRCLRSASSATGRMRHRPCPALSRAGANTDVRKDEAASLVIPGPRARPGRRRPYDRVRVC